MRLLLIRIYAQLFPTIDIYPLSLWKFSFAVLCLQFLKLFLHNLFLHLSLRKLSLYLPLRHCFCISPYINRLSIWFAICFWLQHYCRTLFAIYLWKNIIDGPCLQSTLVQTLLHDFGYNPTLGNKHFKTLPAICAWFFFCLRYAFFFYST